MIAIGQCMERRMIARGDRYPICHQFNHNQQKNIMETDNTYIEVIHEGETFCLKNTSGSIIGFFRTLELAQKQAQSVEDSLAGRFC